MVETIYSDFLQTKTNILIPVLKSGKTLESRYNPEREIENIYNSFEKNYKAFIIAGIGSALLAEYIYTKDPDVLLIVYETYSADYDFLNKNSEIKKRLNNDRILKSTSENLSEVLIQNYIPAKYGDLKIVINPNWNNETPENSRLFNKILTESLSIIKADFSVQSHFGKLWASNFLKNVKIIENNHMTTKLTLPLNKTAVVIGAGPSLDINLEKYYDKNKYYLIATDTAFSVLLNNNITPDVVISLDGQSISRSHFIHSADYKNINFLFDLTSNPSAVKCVLEKHGNVTYFISGHPLASVFNEYTGNKLNILYSGAGTVTITALDFAVKSGFENIEIIGADFAYHSGKSYTKGTYLDTLYNEDSSKVSSSEYIFNKLLFRTELKKDKDLYTTTVLDSYRNSFITYLKNNAIEYVFNDFIYKCHRKNSQSKIKFEATEIKSNFNDFINYFIKINSSDKEKCLLPYIAYLRKKNSQQQFSYDELLKLAHSFIVSYNQ